MCVCVCVCVHAHPSVCASFIIHIMFSLLSVFVFTCSFYLKWPSRRSKPPWALRLSPPEGQIVDPQSAPTCSQWHWQSWERESCQMLHKRVWQSRNKSRFEQLLRKEFWFGNSLCCDGYERLFCSSIHTFQLHAEIAIDFFYLDPKVLCCLLLKGAYMREDNK